MTAEPQGANPLEEALHQSEELLAREREARSRAEEARNRLMLLADASALLASSLDYETTLSSLARAVVPAIADWCAVHLVGQDGSVRQIAVVHRDPEKVRLARELERQYSFDPDAPAGVPNVLRTGRTELLTEVPDELLEKAAPDRFVLGILRGLGLKSWMIVPLETRGRVLGAVSFIAAESDRWYTEDDVALAEVLARRAALAIDNASLFQEARRAAAERAAILTQMTDGLIMCDPDGVVTFMNDAAKNLYGADFAGQSLGAFRNSPDLRDRKGEQYSPRSLPMARALAGETVVAEEGRMTRPDGTLLVLQRSATPISAPDGTLLGAVISVRDVTAERSLEAQKNAFLSAAAHDLRTPLTGIKAMAQVLQRRLKRDEAVDADAMAESLARIESNASRMTSIITELLDLSAIETGERLPLNLQQVDLVGLVRRCIEYHREVTAGQQINLDIQTAELVGAWDADRIERAVSNLLSNAMKYSPDRSVVSVLVAEETVAGEPWALIRVADSGVGIPADDLPHIFKRFHRGSNVGSDVAGTGIGLAGARQIVEQHGGKIEVQSVEGAGSTFSIRLPVVDGASATPSADANQRGETASPFEAKFFYRQLRR
ncbi:MAG TPA: ATP-binding protein [Chloroflexota bacterium]|nr:ATP-binding protein [Chloroflexota bacterium]